MIRRGKMGKILRKAVVITPLLFWWLAVPVGAQPREWLGGTEQQAAGGIATLRGLEAVFNNIVAVSTGLVGIVLFVMLIVGGVKYITSGGEREAAASARKTLTFALLGMVLFVAAYLIMRLIETITGAPVMVFKVYR